VPPLSLAIFSHSGASSGSFQFSPFSTRFVLPSFWGCRFCVETFLVGRWHSTFRKFTSARLPVRVRSHPLIPFFLPRSPHVEKGLYYFLLMTGLFSPTLFLPGQSSVGASREGNLLVLRQPVFCLPLPFFFYYSFSVL